MLESREEDFERLSGRRPEKINNKDGQKIGGEKKRAL